MSAAEISIDDATAPIENTQTNGPRAILYHGDRTQHRGRFVSTKELSQLLCIAESTLRYWRCAGIGPAYVKLGGRIKYDLPDVDAYVRANKRKPSVRAHGG